MQLSTLDHDINMILEIYLNIGISIYESRVFYISNYSNID